MDNAFVVTFPMVMTGILSLVVTLFGLWISRMNAKSEKEDDAKMAAAAIKDAATHQGFVELHARIDKERDKREEVMEKLHMLELMLQSTIKREELDGILKEVRDDVRGMTAQVIQALAARA